VTLVYPRLAPWATFLRPSGAGFLVYDDCVRRINPTTEEPLEEIPDHTPAQVEAKLRSANEAFAAWRRAPMSDRTALMHRAAALLRSRRADLSSLMTREMGKPITAAEAEIDKCAAACDHFADHAAAYLATETIPTDADRSYVRCDPLGAVLAIMPWNFPYWQVIRFAAPALMAGNVALLKHAPNVPGCALALEEVFRAAGFPPGVFTTLLIDTDATAAVIRHPVIRAVTLTGSERAGMAVASTAGKVLKKTVLELGGSDPFIVIWRDGNDRDFLCDAAFEAAKARCINSGQSCIAAKRFIVVGPVDPFEQWLAGFMADMEVGDAMDRATQVGPLARLDLLENLHDQVRRSLDAGARLLTGGERLARKGFYYAPTVLSEVRPGMPAFDEETFGPLAAIIAARDVDEAIHLANQSRYGLGASIWTRDTALAERIAPEIDSGCVFINGAVKSDPRLPFGGIKNSGYGRELSQVGIREFVNLKTVWVKDAPEGPRPPRPE
jgi:succinate-semialdehyde dehydrogenase/glutarate-semialdehyde dehydrogenase